MLRYTGCPSDEEKSPVLSSWRLKLSDTYDDSPWLRRMVFSYMHGNGCWIVDACLMVNGYLFT